ncbi:dolichyl-phosphate beta-glucosyltransferase [Saccharomycopsis crataegensis]|uniref:dolichyl-phosphate beta-glucosyltransferase n=1 Tax=Saccharomycopsis crataegensis TaxID=43959 RepID=A0AAV5QUR8_9ASCO|nr:dolichyl-phosphate beta-glucosyltransferase [Saccharomycopsis crataegensis]
MGIVPLELQTNVILFITGVLLTGLLAVYCVFKFLAHIPRKPYKSELYYTTTTAKKGEFSKLLPLPDANSPASSDIILSVVIPCYNETGRLKVMLDEAIAFLTQTQNLANAFEILIIDDGSKDKTFEYALGIAESYGLAPGIFRAVKLEQNRGKGGAVTHGLQYTRGKYSIFADADGASKFSDVLKLIEGVEKHQSKKLSEETPVVAIGSRAHMVNTDAVVKRSFIRNFLMYSLHSLLFIFGIRSVRDTQCGFKLFNKSAIKNIFPYMHNERWIFDVEILILALRKGIVIEEIPISWHEVSGSKVDLARDSVNMAIDLVVIRFAYMLGIYLDHDKKGSKKD